MICPFCNEPDFDASGLKYHFTYCEEYANVLPMSFCNHCGKCLDCLRIERNDSLKSNVVDVKPDKVQYNEPKADPDCPRCKTQQVNRNHSPQCKKYQESRFAPTIENGVKMWKNSILRSKDCDGYDVYGQTADGYTHLETVRFEKVQDSDKK